MNNKEIKNKIHELSKKIVNLENVTTNERLLIKKEVAEIIKNIYKENLKLEDIINNKTKIKMIEKTLEKFYELLKKEIYENEKGKEIFGNENLIENQINIEYVNSIKKYLENKIKFDTKNFEIKAKYPIGPIYLAKSDSLSIVPKSKKILDISFNTNNNFSMKEDIENIKSVVETLNKKYNLSIKEKHQTVKL